MNQRRIWGGVRKCTPLHKRISSIFCIIPTQGHALRSMANDVYIFAEFVCARYSPIAHIAHAIYRIRRQRAGQLSLFGSKRVPKATRTQFVPFWGWAIPAPRKQRRLQ